jgi:DNA-binding NarL/FixJ family response regulator
MSTNPSDTKIRIVIVENDEDEREFMKIGFESSGKFEVLAMLRNGDLLIDWLTTHKERPEVVLSDLNMPGKNGYDIIELMKERGIPVVITSTSTTTSIIRKSLQAGAAEYMVKPDTFVEYEPFANRLHETLLSKRIVGSAT